MAAVVHAGFYTPRDSKRWGDKCVGVGLPDSKMYYDHEEETDFPDHDLIVSLIVLPRYRLSHVLIKRLVKYTGTHDSTGLFKSRSFNGTHHGESYKILGVKEVPAKDGGTVSARSSPSRKRQKFSGINRPNSAVVHLVSSTMLGSDFWYQHRM